MDNTTTAERPDMDTLGKVIFILQNSRKEILHITKNTKEKPIRLALMDELIRIDYSTEKLEMQRKLLHLPDLF